MQICQFDLSMKGTAMKGFAKTLAYSIAGLGVLSPALGLAASGHPALAALYFWVLLLSSIWIGNHLNKRDKGKRS